MTTPASERTVFIISDGTGITAETFSHSVLSQFESVTFKQVRVPFIDTVEKADTVVQRINRCAADQGNPPIVFTTLVNPDVLSRVKLANALFLDLFGAFVEPLEQNLGLKSSHSIGKSHKAVSSLQYRNRGALPKTIMPHRAKLFGLTIQPERLTEVRHERRPDSQYASLPQCRHEVAEAERLMRRESIPMLSTTTKSIEEISTTVLQEVGLDRHSTY
jgi:regulator of PEP synthase PpsR (kinase-PPPase family)